MINGKLRLAGLAPPSGPGIVGGDGSTRNELYLWHYFGDPSMQMWGGGTPPLALDLGAFTAVFRRTVNPGPGDPPYIVNLTLPRELLGQPISLLRNGDVVGKATAGDGVATVSASFGDGSVKPGDLQIVVNADDAVPVTLPVQGVTDPPPADTTMTIQCSEEAPQQSNDPMTTTGTLSPAFAGAPVTVKYTRPNGGGSFERSATTNGSGQWSHTITPQDEPEGDTEEFAGTWTVEARYAGDADRKASSASCTVFVNDNS